LFTQPGQSTLARYLYWTGGFFLAAHLALMLSAGLSVDEAHYGLYAARLDWSYFDHPPLAGWIQLPALAVGGGDFAMRCAALACWLATLCLARRLVADLFPGADARAAADAACLALLLAPILEVLGVALIPDSLLLPVSCGVMGFTWRLRQPENAARLAPWLGLGVMVGLAGLSKYTGIFLAASAAGVLLVRHGRRILATRGPWVAVAVASALVSPVLAWNAAHGWVSFIFQARHAAGAEWGSIGGVSQFLGSHDSALPGRHQSWDFLAVIAAELVQILAYGPLMVLGLVAGLRGRLRHAGTRFCLAFALPAMAVIAVCAARGGSLPHWTAFAWLALAPVSGAGLAQGWRSGRVRRWIIGIGSAQLALGIAGFATAFVGGPAETSSFRANPFADLYGWRAASLRAEALARENHVGSLAVPNWTLASRLGWYARPMPVHVLDQRVDQFELWFGKVRAGQSVLLVEWSRMPGSLPLAAGNFGGFAECRHVGTMEVRRLGRTLSHFDYYLCTAWRDPASPR
jgi:4-amino-4-deoxy-L-arabinose transferase-like glycosyltransferase